jgi:hypothetical protein
MAIQVMGVSGNTVEVDVTQKAMRVSMRPMEYGALGIYSINLITGVMAAGLAANSEVFQFRWTDATRLAAVTKVDCEGFGGITAFAAGATKLEAMIARGWSADGSGGTAATLTGNNNKLRTSMGTTLVGAIRASSTAALTAGTKTLDSQGVGSTNSSTGVTAGAQILPSDTLFSAAVDGQPIILVTNEGIIMRATIPATGTWTGGMKIKWAEVTSF